MKVLFINTVFGKGSTGRIVRDLGAEIEKNGGEYLVAYGRGEVTDSKHCRLITSTKEMYFHALAARLTDKAGFYSHTPTKRLIKIIEDFNPDIIHIHNLHGYYVNVEDLFSYIKKSFNGKVVWTLHDCWPFTGHCVHFTYAGCDKWKTGCYSCPEKREYPSSLLFDNSEENYKRKKEAFSGVKDMQIVAVSDWLKNTAKQSFLSQYEISRIYNGVDSDIFKPRENNVKEELGIKGKMILLVSDGWNQRKGFDKALSLAAVVPDDWTFVMIGVDKSQIPELPSNIIGIERIWEQKKLIEYYTAADVFFNPSVEETFGLVTAEAMACGTPAVVLDSTACPELIEEHISGKILPVNYDNDSCINTLMQAFEIKTARNVALEFSLDEQMKQYYSLYEKILH